MKLAYKLDSLDGLDEPLKPLYAKGEDGKFVLQVDDSGAKSAIQKERERAEAAEKALKDRQKAEEDAAKAKEREDQEKKGEYEKLKAALEAEAKTAKDQVAALEAKLRNGHRDRAAMEAITAANGIPKALLPHITPLLEVVPDGDDFKVLVKGDPGKKLGDFVAGLKEEMPWGFQATGSTGGGTSTSQGKTSTGQPTSSVELIAAGLKQAGFK